MVRLATRRRRLARDGPQPNRADLAARLARPPLLTMPHGTRHEVTGLLLQQRRALVVDVDGGGTWRLEAGWRARRLLGMRVRVVGVRDGFDLLAVERIEQI